VSSIAASPPPARRAALAFIFVTVLIDCIAFGVVIPVLPQLIKEMAGGSFVDAASWVAIISTSFAFVQFLFTPVQGALSDRYGRRPVILLSNLGLGLDFLIMALVNTLPLLLIARVVSGMTSASFSTANAYIADAVPAEKRPAAFGMMGAAFGVGFVLGPALGGLLGHIDLRLPFWVSAGLALVNFCYGFFILPESLPPERRTKHLDWKRANPVGSLLLLKRYPQVYGLALILFLGQLAHYVLNTVFVLYADYRYDWKEFQVGLVLTLVGVCNVIVQAFLIRRITPKLGPVRMVMTGLFFGALGFAVQGLASTGWVFLLSIPCLALWGMAGPATQIIATRQVDPTEQGRLQGAFASLQSFAGIFGPSLHTSVFTAAVGTYAAWHVPGAPFLVSALLLVIAMVVAWNATHHLAVPVQSMVPAAPAVEMPPLE
jgi:DHA1 family tetracycline resistance protein-like MFS transporter